MARKRRSGNHPKRAYLIDWNEKYDPHQPTAGQYRRWLKEGAIEATGSRRARLRQGFKFLFHEDVGAVIVPTEVGPSIPSFWRIVERLALFDTSGNQMTSDQIRQWICDEYSWWEDRR